MKKKLPITSCKASNVFHQQKTFHLPKRILTSLLFILIFICSSIKLHAQAIPTGVTDTSFVLQSTTYATYFNSSYQNFSVSTYAGIISGTSPNFFVSESTTPNGPDSNYIDVTAASGYTIDSITYFFTGNGANKTLQPAILGWTASRPYSATNPYAPYGFKTDSIGPIAATGLANATPFSYNFSGDTINEVRIYRAIKQINIGTPAIVASGNAFGNAQSLELYAMIVHVAPIIPLPVTFTTIAAKQQTNGTVTVSWKVGSQININQYQVEQSNNGAPYNTIGTITAKAGTANYSLPGINTMAGSVDYRVKAIGNDGTVTYSNIANTIVEASSIPGISVYPNPITGNTIGIRLNNLAAGIYAAQLFNITGQQINRALLNYEGGTEVQNIYIPQSVLPGTYQLKVLTPNNTVYITTVLVR
jgi:hypothetical protein